MSSAKVAWAKVVQHMMGKWKSTKQGNGQISLFLRPALRPPSELKVIVFLSLLRFLFLVSAVAFCILCPRQFNYELFHVRTVAGVDGTRTTVPYVDLLRAACGEGERKGVAGYILFRARKFPQFSEIEI